MNVQMIFEALEADSQNSALGINCGYWTRKDMQSKSMECQ